MKSFIIILGLLFTFKLYAQHIPPGGGQLDPTKKRTHLDFKNAEMALAKNIKENWKECGFDSKEKEPDSFISFFITFKDEKLVLDPNELNKEKKAECPECEAEKKKTNELKLFQCLIHNTELQKILHDVNSHKKDGKKYLTKKIDKYNKDHPKEILTLSELNDFLSKLVIDYE